MKTEVQNNSCGPQPSTCTEERYQLGFSLSSAEALLIRAYRTILRAGEVCVSVSHYRLIGTRLQSDDVFVRCTVSAGTMQGGGVSGLPDYLVAPFKLLSWPTAPCRLRISVS